MIMKLQDFISGTFKGLIDGIVEAQEYVEKKGGAINPIGLKYLKGSTGFVQHKKTSRIGQEVEFDIEITSSKEKVKKGKGHIDIHVIGVGGDMQSTSQDRSVNRMKFKIPVIFPKGDYKGK